MSYRSHVARHTLKNKKILITAGPTWVPIDRVRVISNIATGETGVLLAKELQGLDARVTLLLGPVECACLNKKIKLVRFRFFDELRDLIRKELTSKRYDIVIHSAAVADYRPKKAFREKIKSDIRQLRLDLATTPKIIDSIKKFDSSLLVVGFKFETRGAKKILIRKAREIIRRANLDLAVANTADKNKYLAYIIDNCSGAWGPIYNRKAMAKRLVNVIRSKYGSAENI